MLDPTNPSVAVSAGGDVIILPAPNRGALFIKARDVPRWLQKPAKFKLSEWPSELSPAIATALAANSSLDIEYAPSLVARFTYPNGMTVAVLPNTKGVDLLALAHRVDMVIIPGDEAEVRRRYTHGRN